MEAERTVYDVISQTDYSLTPKLKRICRRWKEDGRIMSVVRGYDDIVNVIIRIYCYWEVGLAPYAASPRWRSNSRTIREKKLRQSRSGRQGAALTPFPIISSACATNFCSQLRSRSRLLLTWSQSPDLPRAIFNSSVQVTGLLVMI